jgi:tetratricopeptide (TPR) repeat protein
MHIKLYQSPKTLVKLFSFLCAILFLNNTLLASGKFEFSTLARSAYDKTMALKLDEADYYLSQLKQKEPDNLMADFIENYKECLIIFVNEEEADYNRYKIKEAKRIAAFKAGDKNSPYYLYCQAQTRLLWAMNKAKFGSWLGAFNETTEAFSLLESNQKKFPNFLPNKMSLGVLHGVVGSIPDDYKGGLKFFTGMNGTVEQGQREIEEVIQFAKNNDFQFEQEALVLYAFLMLHLNNQTDNAWAIMNNAKLKPRENILSCFALANVATRTGHNDKAIEILQNRPTGQGFLQVHYLDYMLAMAKLYRGDGDADVYIKLFLQNFKGRNYIKEGYQRLAWHELLKGNYNGYKSWIENCKTKGYTDIGNDKNALKEAKQGLVPEPTLLRARLYFDGGYFQKAADFMQNKNEANFPNTVHKLEYYYRMGRIYHSMKKTNEAIAFYDKTIQVGKSTKYYFACNAALQLGMIYEDYKQYAKAREFYNFCLQLSPDDYADAFHAKAKARLSRIKNK